MPTRLKERRIMQAAEELFTSRRFHEITLDDICRRAGVGKGTIYRYFEDKNDLFVRVAMSGFEELCELIGQIADANLPFERQLGRVLSEIHSFFLRRRPLFRIMQSEEIRVSFCRGTMRSELMKRRAELVRRLSDFLRRGVKAGTLRNDIPLQTIAFCLLGMLRGSLWHGRPQRDTKQTLAAVTELFLRGCASRDAKGI